MGPEGSNLKFSENQNDFWVLDKKHYAKSGYFVDLGAGDGITGSNTYTLEKFYNWEGICVDPNPSFLKSLCGSRDVLISDLAVWNVSGQILDFSYLSQNRKEFFDDYDVDWRYGDSNHGATMKCLEQGLKYLHLGPYYDNPNFDSMEPEHYNTYYYDSVEFLSHLKGGFSENKLSEIKQENTQNFLEAINDRI